MKLPRNSIRIRLALGTAGVVFALGLIFGLGSFLWLRSSLDAVARSFGLHEAQEIGNLVATLPTREDVLANSDMLGRLFPEEGVVGLEVFGLDGELVYRLPAAGSSLWDTWPEGLAAARRGESPYRIQRIEGAPAILRTAMLVTYLHEPRWLVTATVRHDRVDASLVKFALAYSAGLLGAVVFAFFGSVVLLSRALKPVQDMVADAELLGSKELERRLAQPPEGYELAKLAALLNRMLGKTEELVGQLRRFTSNAGHELRTPLARIRGEAELALSTGGVEEMRDALASALEELEGLRRIIDGLLELAQGEEQDLRGEAPLDLGNLVSEICDESQIVASVRDIGLEAEVVGPVWVQGSRVLLARLLWNLLDNAIKYAPAGGRVSAHAHLDGSLARVEIEDNGPGLEGLDLERVFEPFFRGPAGRSEVAGQGLGLALSRTIARRHGGDLTASHARGLTGARFTLTLPPIPAPSRSLGRVATQQSTQL